MGWMGRMKRIQWEMERYCTVLTILIFYTIRIHSPNRIHNSLSSPLPINKFRTTANNVTSLPNLDFVSNFLTFINSTLNHYQYLNAQIRSILFLPLISLMIFYIFADYQGRVHGLLQRDQCQHRPGLLLWPDDQNCLEVVIKIKSHYCNICVVAVSNVSITMGPSSSDWTGLIYILMWTSSLGPCACWWMLLLHIVLSIIPDPIPSCLEQYSRSSEWRQFWCHFLPTL